MFKQVLIKMAANLHRKVTVDSKQVTCLDVLYHDSPDEEGTAGMLVK